MLVFIVFHSFILYVDFRSPASNVDAPDNDLLLSLIASQNEVKIEPQITLEQKPTKLIINNGSAKRVIIPKQQGL